MRGILAALTIKLSADSATLKKDFDKATKDGRTWAGEMQTAGKNVATAFGVAAAASAAALGAIALKAIESQDKLGKFAERIGATAESVSRLQFAAQRSGVATNVLDKGLEVISKRTSEAAQGIGESVGAFNELNLSAEKLRQVSPDRQFVILADALNKVENASDKTRLAMKLFGDEGAALLQVTQEGSAGIAALAAESDRLGATVSTSSTKMAAEASDAIDNMKAGFGGIANQLAVQFAPVITDVANTIAKYLPDAIEFVQVAFHALRRAGMNVFDTLAASIQTIGGVLYTGLAAPLAGILDMLASAMEKLNMDGAASMRGLSDAMAQSVEQGIEYALAVTKLGDKYEENNKVYEQAIDALQSEKMARMEQMAATQNAAVTLADYTGKNISKAESDKAAAEAARLHAQALKEQEAEMERLRSRAESIWQSVQTPQEQYIARLNEIKELEMAGALAAEQANEIRARMAAQALQNSDSMNAARSMLGGVGDMTGQADPMMAAQMEWEGKLAALQWMNEQEMITQAEFDALRIEALTNTETEMTRIQAEEAARRAEIEKMSTLQKTQWVMSSMVKMTQGVANHSKKMFQINKAAAIGNALLNTYEAVSSSFAKGSEMGGPYLGAIFAAVALAAQIAQVNAIKSTKFGGGTTPSVAGSVPTYNNTPVTSGNSQNTAGEGPGGGNSAVNVTVNIGKVDASEGITADNLASKIQSNVMRETVIGIVQDHVKNDGVLIPAGSRQAAEIGGGG